MSEEYESRWILEEEEPPRENWAVPVIMIPAIILMLYFTIEGIQKSKRR